MDENKDLGFQVNLPEGETTEDDEFVIGRGFTVAEPEPDISKKSKKGSKKGKSIKNIIWILSILVISCSIAFGAIYVGADYMGIAFGRNGEEVTFEVEKGSSVQQIAEVLEDAGVVKSPLMFRLYVKMKGYGAQFKYGVYTVKNDCGYGGVADKLITEGAKAESVKVTIPEGTGINDYVKNVNGEKVTVKGIATILEEAGICTKADFFAALDEVEFESELLKNANYGKAYYALEGYLFAETYQLYNYDSKECARLAVKRMISESEKQIDAKMFARAKEMGYTMNEILTMASIIQMESGQNTSEMANVAAVFYNRLKSDSFATLGSSPTCYYGNSFKNDDGRYDTYKAKGLPPGPLCSPSIDAIKAALYPTEDVPYYYFVTDSKGKFYFHKTLAEQNVTINRLKKDGNWVYEYFD